MKTIPLTQGLVAIVDDEDYERITVHKWWALRSRYANRWYAGRTIQNGKGRRSGQSTARMHREILGLSLGDGMSVDHRNGNTLDNRRSNLRIATNSQNLANGGLWRNNRSGFRGVHWHKGVEKWCAQIRAGGVGICLGYFNTKEQAAEAYRRAAEQHFGDFAFHRRCVHEKDVR